MLAAWCSSAVLSRTNHEKALETLFADIQVRAHVAGIKARLEGGLAAVAAAAAGDAAFTSSHLEDVAPLATPLLASPLVGEGAAWEAVRAMAAALPRGLNIAATSLATALRLVSLQAATGEAAHRSTPGFRIAANSYRLRKCKYLCKKCPLCAVSQANSCRFCWCFSYLPLMQCSSLGAGYPTHKELAAHPAARRSVALLAAATADGQPLPGPAWAFAFPVVQAHMRSQTRANSRLVPKKKRSKRAVEK